MTRGQMKSHFIVHTNGQDEWIKVDKRTYDKAIDMFCDAHKTELKVKEEKHGDELQALLNDMGRAISKLSGELKTKDEHIANLSAERDKYNTIAANLQISRQKAYDTIAELEAIIEKMKCCENCKSHTNVGSKCLLDMKDRLACMANNFSNWKLKETRNDNSSAKTS